MSIELKIKAKSLAAEARIIRKEERIQLEAGRWCLRNQKPDMSFHQKYQSLNHHRRGTVRKAARYTGLARAYLAGVAYKTVEQPTRKLLNGWDMKQIAQMISTYGGETKEQALNNVTAWVCTEEAKATKKPA